MLLAFFTLAASVALAQDTPAPMTAMAPMRDGVRLATDLYLPRGPGPWPVVVIRTPYGRKNQAQQANNFVRNGFAFVSQDWRGLFDSEGRFSTELVTGIRNQEDGYDTVEWIARQPWSNGKVGITGGSGPGIAAKQAIVSDPPHLLAAVTSVSCIYVQDREAYEGGVHPTQTDQWIGQRGVKFDTWPRPRTFPFEKMPVVWPLPRKEAAKAARIAVLDSGGWFDIFSPCLFSDLAALGGKNNRTIIAPKGHGAFLGGELKYPPRENAGASALAWFDHWLKGEENGVMNTPPIAYFLMGDTMDTMAPGNRWKQAERWPIASTPASFYLTKERQLKAAAGEGGELAYAYDPKNPVPTTGGPNMGQNNGPQDQRKLKDRADILRFTSEPLAAPLEITGKGAVELYISTDITDTTLVVKLIDVYPNGYEALMLDQGFMARYWRGFNKPSPIEPGKVYKLTINFWDTALVFNKGHRIGLHITGSESPRYEVHPNSFAPVTSYVNAPVAHVSIHVGAAEASRLILPVIAPGAGKD